MVCILSNFESGVFGGEDKMLGYWDDFWDDKLIGGNFVFCVSEVGLE